MDDVINLELSKYEPFKNLKIMDHFRNLTFRTIPKISYFVTTQKFHIWIIPEVLHYQLVNIFTIWTIQEFTNFGQFKNVHNLNHIIMLTFFTIPEFLHCGPFQNFHIVDHSIIFISWTISDFLPSYNGAHMNQTERTFCDVITKLQGLNFHGWRLAGSSLDTFNFWSCANQTPCSSFPKSVNVLSNGNSLDL